MFYLTNEHPMPNTTFVIFIIMFDWCAFYNIFIALQLCEIIDAYTLPLLLLIYSLIINIFINMSELLNSINSQHAIYFDANFIGLHNGFLTYILYIYFPWYISIGYYVLNKHIPFMMLGCCSTYIFLFLMSMLNYNITNKMEYLLRWMMSIYENNDNQYF